MAITKYDLDINKQAIIKPVVILRQGDHDIDTMQVSLSVANEPMNLTGATVTFMGSTANGRQIIDDAHVKIIDAKGGVFEYVFPSQAASDIGEYKVAYFSIILANGQSSTMDFRVQVLSGVDISAPVASEYITHYDTMVTALNSAYDSATKATNQKMASTVSSLATSAATVLDSALARANTVNSTANNASSAASKAVSMASSVASTVTSQASYINSVASSAASNVSSVAAGVVNKLNNISVGGRNYILNSSGMGASASNTPVLSGGTGDSNSKIDLQADRIVMTNNNGSSEFFYGLTKAWTDITKTPLIAGNTYTLSVKARGTSPQIALRIGFQNMNPVAAIGFTNLDNTKWTKATFTFTIPVGTPFIYMRLNGGINNQVFGFAGNETIEFKEVMLEQSNVASDWTPAPEDAPSNDAQLVHKTGDTMTGSLTVGGNPVTGGTGTYIGRDGSIELGAATAFIDFHGGNSTSDFTSRMYDSGDGIGNKIVDKSGFKVISTPLMATSTNKYNLDTVTFGSLVLTGYSHKVIVSVRTDLLGTSPYMPDGTTNGLDNVVITWERGYNEKYGTQTITNLWESMTWQRSMRNGVWQPWVMFADDGNVVHKTSNETIAGDKTFTGITNIQNQKQYKASFTIGANTINLTRIGSVVYVSAKLKEKINGGNSYGAIPIGFFPANDSVINFIRGNDQGSCLFQAGHKNVWFPVDAPFDSNISGSYLTSDALPS